jgi:predicted TIM-barrel fold metal-dependent hydrolase
MTWAIDVHIHADADPRTRTGRMKEFHDAAVKYFGVGHKDESVDATADMYRELDMMAVLLAVNSESGLGTPAVSNEFVAEAMKKHPDVYIGFASVDPWRGKISVDEVKHAVEELGLKGFKFHPATQNFYPNERQFYPIYEAIARHDVPILIHTGTTGIGAGMPGGAGIKLGTCRPIPYIDDIAADFPDTNFILAHPSWPWQDEALAMAVHKPNVFIDLSGWSPKYFSESLVRYSNSLLQDKVMFGTDYPLITPERWLSDFAKAPFKDPVRPKILFETANRLLKLGLERTPPPAALSGIV